MNKTIINIINDSIKIKNKILTDDILLDNIDKIVNIIVKCYNNNGKVLFCGNGGSAADAQHLASELSGKFYKDRTPLYAEALHVNSSYLTAVANDYGFQNVYSRLIEAMGNKNDILIGISTSGDSENIINAFETANKKEMITIGFTGEFGGNINDFCDYIINIPSTDTPRIQENHIMVGHIICELVEKKLFK